PPGLTISEVAEVALTLPSIQSQMRSAEYRVRLAADADVPTLEARIAEVMAQKNMPWQHLREKELRSYDLRPLIQEMGLNTTAEGSWLTMRLQADTNGTGRPEQVLAALALRTAASIERTRLNLVQDIVEQRTAPEEPVSRGSVQAP
ncbi:MAG: DUF2344 domain-containing protein, partial [Dehalococcoidia bacterium]